MSSIIGNPGALGVNGISGTDLASMDIETALMMVQAQRTNQLDAQLQAQIKEVQQRNEMVAQLNDVLAQLSSALSRFPSDAAADATLAGTSGWDSGSAAMLRDNLARQLDNAGLNSITLLNADLRVGVGDMGGVSRGALQEAVTDVKAKLDSVSNAQQMDMLRLQSLSNKRNEAFDVMTNFIKKMQESRSSIIGSMR